MAITLNSTGFSTGFSTTHTHTVSGNPDAVVVICSAGSSVTAVSYGSSGMTQIGTEQQGVGEHSGTYISGWILTDSAPTGNQTVTVTTTSGLSCTASYALDVTSGEIEFNNNVTGAATSQTNPSTSLSLSSTTSFVAMAWGSGQDDPTGTTPLSGWTSVREEDIGSNIVGQYRYDTIGSSDVSVGATQSSADWLYGGYAVNEVSSSAIPPSVFINSNQVIT